MKTYPVISACPMCQGELHVSKLHCHQCQTTIEGNFTLSKFNYLPLETLYFIEVFLKNRGNIKAIEKELDLSYPTIKKMLDDVVRMLGYEVKDEKEESDTKRSDVLAALKEGSISAKEAISQLEKLKGK